jgi:hypothetical protein
MADAAKKATEELEAVGEFFHLRDRTPQQAHRLRGMPMSASGLVWLTGDCRLLPFSPINQP